VTEAGGQELNTAIAEGSTVVVEFWAPWCAHCAAMRSVIDRLADGLDSRAKVVTVNIEEHPAVAEHYEVTTLPSLMLFRGGELRVNLVGFNRLPAVMERFRGHLNG
jgi:thioredoxin 1